MFNFRCTALTVNILLGINGISLIDSLEEGAAGNGRSYAVKQVKEEVETYKKNMERNHTKYKIVEQTEQPDGSIIVKIIKQYNAAPVGDYLN